jgi:hypothetical protein
MSVEGEAGGPDTVPAAAELTEPVRRILDAAWRPAGFTAPNPSTYPWQWLWDSCFHAVVWAHLGDERCLVELGRALDAQDVDGFVPHINYRGDTTHARFWGRPSTSSITQPPMYGHALAELIRLGFDPSDELAERCRAGLRNLIDGRRPGHGGLVRLCHPWESGADDSPRWDHWCPGGFETSRWFDRKGTLLSSIVRGDHGAPVDNPEFDVSAVGFNALVAFNARELATATDDADLLHRADELATSVSARWVPDLETWTDAGEGSRTSGRVRTTDALLPALCVDDPRTIDRVLDLAVDPTAYGGPCGPAGVHRDESVFSPDTYWRGPAWPQLTYLLWLAARRAGDVARADDLALMARRGAVRSGFAEYWNPTTGRGLGAVPQSWTTLAVVMTDGSSAS